MHSLWIVLILIALCACQSQDGARPLTVQRGTEQGNGLTSYTNNVMGVSFKYPSNWALKESADKRKVSLEDGDHPPSQLQFDYKTNLDGRRFNNFSELKDFLIARDSSREWAEVILLGEKALYWTSPDGIFENAQYFVLDKNGFVLEIQYRLKKHVHAEEIIKAIMRGMLIDEESPVIKEVWFDRATALPGEKIRLFVHAVDRLSGVNLNRLGNESDRLTYSAFIDNAPNSPINSSVGYVFQNYYPNGMPDGHQLDLFRSFELYDPFIYLGEDIYAYDIKIPKKSPPGKVMLNSLWIEDHFGNTTSLLNNLYIADVDEYGNAKYGHRIYDTYFYISSDHHKPSVPIRNAQFEVLPSADGQKNDITAPVLKDAYFNKTSVSAEDPYIELTLIFEDESPILYRSDRYASGICKGEGRVRSPWETLPMSDRCMKADDIRVTFLSSHCQHLPTIDVDRDGARWRQTDANTFTVRAYVGCTEDAPNPPNAIIYLGKVEARDEVGNKRRIVIQDSYKRAKFFVTRK